MHSYEDFSRTLKDWAVGDTGNVPPSDQRVYQLYQRLDLRDYAERMYILCKDDVRDQAENMEIDLQALGLEGNEQFWDLVKDGIESGTMGWDTNIQEAIKEAINLLKE